MIGRQVDLEPVFMKRTLIPAALAALILANGCAAFYPTESRIVTSNWVGSPVTAQFQWNLPPDNTPVPYCYNTIGTVECHYAPLARKEQGRIVNAYTGARPRVEKEDKPDTTDTQGDTEMVRSAANTPARATTVQAPVPVVQVPKRRAIPPATPTE